MDGPVMAACPVGGDRDDRKSAGLAARRVEAPAGSERVRSFDVARELLRHAHIKQSGAGAEHIDVGNPEHVPVFYLDGEIHRKRRAAIAKFFAPKAINGRYRLVMEQTTDALLARFRARGEARLDEISFELAVAVAADIVGLTNSDLRGMSGRLGALLASAFHSATGVTRLVNHAKRAWYGYRFYTRDVLPAVRARRKRRQEDVISQTIERGYSDKAIMIECMTYASAGMVTTREFIVMVAWHLFDTPALRERFLASDETGQIAILQEILRLEPVAALVYRRADEDVPELSGRPVAAGERFAIDIRAANTDPAAVGECPFAIDTERARRQNQNGAFMSFGDGAHHCPGWQVALHETRVFVDALMRVPGIRLKRAPDMLWNAALLSYELRRAIVVCDRA